MSRGDPDERSTRALERIADLVEADATERKARIAEAEREAKEYARKRTGPPIWEREVTATERIAVALEEIAELLEKRART